MTDAQPMNQSGKAFAVVALIEAVTWTGLLLGMFLQQPGVVLDRDTISDATRGRESLPMERGIDVQISRLRARSWATTARARASSRPYAAAATC